MADTRKCRTCIYRGRFSNRQVYCNYLQKTGHSRPCEPGSRCTAYKKGEYEKERKDLLLDLKTINSKRRRNKKNDSGRKI